VYDDYFGCCFEIIINPTHLVTCRLWRYITSIKLYSSIQCRTRCSTTSKWKNGNSFISGEEESTIKSFTKLFFFLCRMKSNLKLPVFLVYHCLIEFIFVMVLWQVMIKTVKNVLSFTYVHFSCRSCWSKRQIETITCVFIQWCFNW
jgi:hypothetical protein